jgi:hypothetical protein
MNKVIMCLFPNQTVFLAVRFLSFHVASDVFAIVCYPNPFFAPFPLYDIFCLSS